MRRRSCEFLSSAKIIFQLSIGLRIHKKCRTGLWNCIEIFSFSYHLAGQKSYNTTQVLLFTQIWFFQQDCSFFSISLKWNLLLTSTIEKSSRTLCGFYFFNGGTKSQDFTSLREAQLHSKTKFFLHIFTYTRKSCLWSRFIMLTLHYTCEDAHFIRLRSFLPAGVRFVLFNSAAYAAYIEWSRQDSLQIWSPPLSRSMM